MDVAGTDADAFRAFEVTGWDQEGWPEAYHRFFGQLTSRAIEPLLEAVGAGTGIRLLDVGTGPGYVAAAAAARGASAVGVDAATRMLALAARLHSGPEFRQTDAEAVDPAGPVAAARRLGDRAALMIYECPTCEARYLGQRHCPDCHRFCRKLGPGGACPHCDEPILLADLLGTEVLP